jgi:dihydroorotate dehydrogenase
VPREIYKEVVSHLLDNLDSETWHLNAREALHFAEASPFTLKLLEQFAHERKRFTDKRLQVVLGGIEFDNPLVVGAGWDKEGRAIKGLHALGFAGVEVGSVLAYPQAGNSKPRQFMIGPGVSLNSLGFPSLGMEAVAQNLERYRDSGIPVGISLGINKGIKEKDAPEAHAVVARRLYEYAAYFAINVSSPNTPGLRELQNKTSLTDIVQAIRKPTFIKISPDLTKEAIDEVIRVVTDNDLAGIIATNTTIRPEIKETYGPRWKNIPGGLGGSNPEFRHLSTETIAHVYRETKGAMEIIGIGGVNSAETALEKFKAGAKIIQLVTAIREEGTSLPGRINSGLIDYMDREGIQNLEEIRGSNIK